jgi:hypothetical protein
LLGIERRQTDLSTGLQTALSGDAALTLRLHTWLGRHGRCRSLIARVWLGASIRNRRVAGAKDLYHHLGNDTLHRPIQMDQPHRQQVRQQHGQPDLAPGARWQILGLEELGHA